MNAHDIALNLAACNTLSELYTARRLARAWRSEQLNRVVSQLGTVTQPLSDEDVVKEHRRLVEVAKQAYNDKGSGWAGSYHNGNIIGAIKAIRAATGWGLYESKQWCDKHRSEFA